jgi:glutamate carboxypeptidase
MIEPPLLELLQDLVEIESPSYSPGVRRVAQRVGDELSALGAAVSFVDGDHLLAELPGEIEGSPLLIIGHTDTVWDEGTLASMPFRIEDGRAYGPGAYDMKGGLVVLLESIRLAGPRRRALRVFLTADEEQASRTARAALAEAADGVAAALVVEPPSGDGHLKTARKGLGRFRLTVTGRAAHAGTGLVDGASAIEELAHQILRLHQLTDLERGISVNVGVVSGGTRENVVAAYAEAALDVRVTHRPDLERLEHALSSLEPVVEDTSIELTGEWTRPPLEPTPESERLFSRAREIGRDLGLDLEQTLSGGGSDGNLVGALGVPVLDGLGADGAGAHALNEHVLLDSLSVRALLLAGLLRDPGL